MMASRERMARLLEAKAARRASILERLLTALFGRVERVEWRDRSAVRDFDREAAELIRIAQRQAGQVAAAAARRVAAELEIPESDPGDESVSLAVQARPSDLEEVTIAIREKFLDLKEDDEEGLDDLLGEAERSLERIADDALTSADRDVQAKAYQQVGRRSRERIVYRRVVHPELSRGGSCGLCVAASTRVYTTPDLKPIHSRCHCDVLPITSHQDIADAMNAADLGRMYKVGGSTSPADLKRVRVSPDGEITSTLKGEKTPTREVRSRQQRTPTATPRADLGVVTPAIARQQLELMADLPDTAWKRKQTKRLRQILADAA